LRPLKAKIRVRIPVSLPTPLFIGFLPPVGAPNRELLDELRTDITQPEQPGTQGPAIRIMIQHKSKGLTARLLVIAACVAGILPSIELTATIQEQARHREEQRRLFFVGLTRSTGTLE